MEWSMGRRAPELAITLEVLWYLQRRTNGRKPTTWLPENNY